MRARMAITEFRQGLATHELQAPFGVVAMDFLHIELALKSMVSWVMTCPAP